MKLWAPRHLLLAEKGCLSKSGGDGEEPDESRPEKARAWSQLISRLLELQSWVRAVFLLLIIVLSIRDGVPSMETRIFYLFSPLFL